MQKILPTKELWKNYIYIILQVFTMFFVALTCIAIFFIRSGSQWVVSSIFMVMLFLFVLIAGIRRLIQHLPMVILMTLAPIGPLVVLIFVISIIPILEYVRP